ncbi:MAG: hypothetical protein RR827_02760 [Oscillospiraceae bacterium]
MIFLSPRKKITTRWATINSLVKITGAAIDSLWENHRATINSLVKITVAAIDSLVQKVKTAWADVKSAPTSCR